MKVPKVQLEIKSILYSKFFSSGYIFNNEPFENIVKRELAKPWKEIPRDIQKEILHHVQHEYDSIGESYPSYNDMDNEERDAFKTAKRFLKSKGIQINEYQFEQ